MVYQGLTNRTHRLSYVTSQRVNDEVLADFRTQVNLWHCALVSLFTSQVLSVPYKPNSGKEPNFLLLQAQCSVMTLRFLPFSVCMYV